MPVNALLTKSNQTPQQVSEYLRQTLSMLSRRRISPTPMNYCLFYAYVSGACAELKTAMDDFLGSDGQWTEEVSEALFSQFLMLPDEEEIEVAREELRKTLSSSSQHLSDASKDTQEYSSTLAKHIEDLSESPDADHLNTIVSSLMDETRSMEEKSSELQGQIQSMSSELRELKDHFNRVSEEAVTDSLTGLMNRRGFDKTIGDMVARMRSEGKPLSMLMGDIDFFKNINDQYGHIIGDDVLKYIAKALSKGTRSQDLVVRYGGEEFLVVLPDTRLEDATEVAEQMRKSICAGRLKHSSVGKIGKVTMSFGVATMEANEDLEVFMHRGDSALYRAKRNGRNCVQTS